MDRLVTLHPVMPALAISAPARIAGQYRNPRTRSAARAMPVGAHTAVALGWRNAMLSPSFAATTYKVATVASRASESIRPAPWNAHGSGEGAVFKRIEIVPHLMPLPVPWCLSSEWAVAA